MNANELSISIIAYKNINLHWLKELKARLNARIILCFDEPENYDFKDYCDTYIINFPKLGFGKNRRLSMLLASELSNYCIVTDGDGQYSIDSIEAVVYELLKRKWDVIVPQRTNKKVRMKFKGQLLDRSQFELLESLCALELLKSENFDKNFDAQPGLFGFKSSIVNEILPEDLGWLADFEITLNAIKKTKYSLINVPINQHAQSETNFSIDAQVNKFKSIIDTYKLNIKIIYENNKILFKNPESNIIEEILESISN